MIEATLREEGCHGDLCTHSMAWTLLSSVLSANARHKPTDEPMTRTNQHNGEVLTPNFGPAQRLQTPASEATALHELRNHLAAIEGFAVAIGEGLTDPKMKEYLSGILRNVSRCVRVVSVLRPPLPEQPTPQWADRVSREWPMNERSFLVGVQLLLVEDDDDVAEVTCSFLQRSGASVVRVADGDEVVGALQDANAAGRPFALILLDIHMARMSGLEAIKEVRLVDEQIPIVILTSDNASSVRDASIANGASGFLQKPIEYSSLVCFLAAYLGAGEISATAGVENDVEAEVREEPSGVANRVERERKGGTGDIPRRVLVVDDNEDSAEAMALLLQRFGHDVTVAFSGSRSIELMGMGPTQPEIVFLDLELPDMHGTQVAQLMRANGFSGKVIALSGHSEHSIKERCAKAGIDHFLCKPCSVQDLRTLM